MKLLEWGDALFLVRYELGQLLIQRVDVGADEKRISLRLCNVKSDSEAAALPVDAQLVAAKQVEDVEMATRYPVLVFQTSQAAEAELTASSSPVSASRKRRRAMKGKEAVTTRDELLAPSSSARDRLFFYILYDKEEDGEIGLRFLNMLDIPTHAGANGNEVAVGDSKLLQVFLTDGPHVLLFGRCLQLATVLKLQRARQGGSTFGFYVWREQLAVAVVGDVTGDTPSPFEVASCTYVPESHCTRPHILIHKVRSPPPSSVDCSQSHSWGILDCGDEQQDHPETGIFVKCNYLPLIPSAAGCNAAVTKTEQITCCCFISEFGASDFTASLSSETVPFTSWEQKARTRSARLEVGVSTLLVTGTTSNTVYVHQNGILLVSYVLPKRPAEMWCLCDDSMDQHYVICVRCDDVDRSFFMLGFSSKVENMSMELLLSFIHVGHAYTGMFAGVHASAQVLLLNDVSGLVDTNNYRSRDTVEGDKSLVDRQLVKRSVLVTQKLVTPEVKLSCLRLRLREEKKDNHSSCSRKRSRNNEKYISKDDPADSKAGPFRYIERTQRVSSRDKSAHRFDEDTNNGNNSAASHAQLGKLASSLSTRLNKGLEGLERLHKIMSDKHALIHQLNQLIARQWQKHHGKASPSKEHSLLTSLISTEEIDYVPESRGFVNLEPIVSAPSTVAVILKNGSSLGPNEQIFTSMLSELKLEQQVSLEQFRVLEYVPSSSLAYAEVTLKNLSDTMLNDSFVVLTAPKGGITTTQGWTCSCSVVPEFPPAKTIGDFTIRHPGTARFQLELRFAPSFSFLRVQKSFEVMLWLHWGASPSEATRDWRPSESALAVALVKICPDDLLGVSQQSLTKSCEWRENTVKEQEQLLLISSGSNLGSLLGSPNFRIPTVVASVVRPMFALMSVNVRSHELLLYELSRLVASLPSDVYAMLNPFRPAHLHALQNVLRSLRQEIAAQENCSVATIEKTCIENGVREKHRKHALRSKKASIHRAKQQNTDLQVNQLLQGLQKRVNFHTQWFAAAAAGQVTNPSK